MSSWYSFTVRIMVISLDLFIFRLSVFHSMDAIVTMYSSHWTDLWRDWSLVYGCISTTWSTVCHSQTADADCTQITCTETLEQLTWRWKAGITSCVMQQNQNKIEICRDGNKMSHLSPETEVILWPRSVDRSQYLRLNRTLGFKLTVFGYSPSSGQLSCSTSSLQQNGCTNQREYSKPWRPSLLTPISQLLADVWSLHYNTKDTTEHVWCIIA